MTLGISQMLQIVSLVWPVHVSRIKNICHVNNSELDETHYNIITNIELTKNVTIVTQIFI